MQGNLFTDLSPLRDTERFDELAAGREFSLRRIVSHGQTTPPGEWYDQAEDEWVVVVRGSATLLLAEPERRVEMEAGDWLLLPAHCRHRVERTDSDPPTVWLALHFHR